MPRTFTMKLNWRGKWSEIRRDSEGVWVVAFVWCGATFKAWTASSWYTDRFILGPSYAINGLAVLLTMNSWWCDGRLRLYQLKIFCLLASDPAHQKCPVNPLLSPDSSFTAKSLFPILLPEANNPPMLCGWLYWALLQVLSCFFEGMI